MTSILTGWWFNPTIWSGVCAWFLAQGTKMLCFYVRTRHVNFGYLVSTGGMPSAHSCMASALATSVALRVGTADPLFAVTAAFALVVMFDAQSVRRAAGMQARVLNQMVDELFQSRTFSREKLEELLGHTQLEVFMGMIMGILVALIVHARLMIQCLPKMI
ncbi:MAG: divergent PAP2 family protein [Verrucomicrobia bacterium]|nr:divergent PAP2 family protein [Verrucomicrobiota bacterium]MCG2681747.1 divergent PAP2 family protein [Kiritimatiellia bacterium]MBU4247161.1 divergent PAP2 family protein [Verrucomicrobiota bacterium]MBU4291065.1 divergent PAP2 family protein [Verrucomicrobiota bacterium]MBU4429716.1 divergent PAP2 family protein [Verrucomicrobiota bacterium]